MNQQYFSPFQLHGVRITDLSVKNPLVSLYQKNLELSLSIKNSEIIIQEAIDELRSTFSQTLTVTAREKGESDALEITLSLEGFFTTKDKNKELFTNMLLLNGNTSLYSIARSHIITITSLALNNGNITLPFVNFVDLLNQKRIETE